MADDSIPNQFSAPIVEVTKPTTKVFTTSKTYKIQSGSYTARDLLVLAKEVAKELGYKVTKS